MKDITPYGRPAQEWEIKGFCPDCKISMMFYEINHENSWECGRCCPKCQFVYDPYGGYDGEWGDDGKLLEIRMFHAMRLRMEVGESG